MQTDNRFKNIDPYVVVCRGALSKRTPVSSGNDPKWKEDARAILEFPVEEPQSERLRLRAMEEDTYTDDDFLGDADLDVLGALEQVCVCVCSFLQEKKCSAVGICIPDLQYVRLEKKHALLFVGKCNECTVNFQPPFLDMLKALQRTAVQFCTASINLHTGICGLLGAAARCG